MAACCNKLDPVYGEFERSEELLKGEPELVEELKCAYRHKSLGRMTALSAYLIILNSLRHMPGNLREILRSLSPPRKAHGQFNMGSIPHELQGKAD